MNLPLPQKIKNKKNQNKTKKQNNTKKKENKKENKKQKNLQWMTTTVFLKVD